MRAKIYEMYIEFKWKMSAWYLEWQNFSLKDYLKKKIFKFLDLLQPENIYRRGHDIIAPKLIKKYMRVTGYPQPSPETCTFISELVGWYCVIFFSIFFVAFILPEVIKSLAWSIFIGYLLLKYCIIYVLPVCLFFFIIFKILFYILTHWHFIVICVYLRARGKWKFRAHTSFKSESKLKKLRSRRRNKILLFFFFWLFIFYFGTYDMYVFATWNYLFWLFWLAYSKLDYVYFYAGINPAHKDYEELMQLASDLEQLNNAGPEEAYIYHMNKARKKKGLPPLPTDAGEGYYIFYKLKKDAPLIFVLNSIRMWWWDFLRYWPLLIAYLFITIPDIIIFHFEWWHSFPKDHFFNHYFQGGKFDNPDTYVCWPLDFEQVLYLPYGYVIYLWLRYSVISILPEKSLSTPEEKLTADEEKFFIEELGYDEWDFDEADSEDLEEEIVNFQSYINYGEIFGPGELCWTWFYNREKQKRKYFTNFWAPIDGPAFVDRHEWGWEYYKFMLLGKFCSDCLTIERYLMNIESIPLLVEYMDDINERHTRYVDRVGNYYWRDDAALYAAFLDYQTRCHTIVFWAEYDIVL